MKTRLIRIGSSLAVHIPRSLLDQARLEGDLEIRAEANSLVIRSAKQAREGWAESFEKMARRGDDVLRDGVVAQSAWDEGEWEW